MVIGASGTGKSRCFIRPAVFQAVKRKYGTAQGESVIITDPKGELFTDLSEFLKDQGYLVRVFNLVNPAHSDSWNCMANLHGDPFIAQILVDAIISNTSHDKGDHFWDSGESNLLKALMLYVDLDPTLESADKNLSSVYQMLIQHTERQLSLLFDRLPLDHPARAPYNLFAQASDTVRAGIVLGLGTRLQALQSPAIQRLISGSGISLTAPAQQKCAYFVILSDQHDAFDFLSSLFFSMLFIELIQFADNMPDGRCPVPVNLVLDELNNLGTIPAFPRRVSSCRSRTVQIYMAIQGLGQLQNRYPDNLWAAGPTVRSNLYGAAKPPEDF